MSINTVTISGNLTRDCELRATPSGTAVLELAVACNDKRKNSSTGEWDDYPNYISCKCFGTRANALAKYMTKGTFVTISGKLSQSRWEKDGQKREKLEIVFDNIDWKTKTGQTAKDQQPKDQNASQEHPAVTMYDDDAPF